MLAGSGDDGWTRRHKQRRPLQPETGVESTECFRKASKPVSFFFFLSFLRGRLIPAPFTVLSTYMGAAPCGRRCRLTEQNAAHFNSFWITWRWLVIKCPGARLFLNVEDKPLCDSYVVAGHLMADNFSIWLSWKMRRKDETDLKDSAFTGSLNCRYIAVFFFS